MAFRNESRAAKIIREIFESGRPLTYIRSAEEQRVAKVLGEWPGDWAPRRPCPYSPGASPRACAARANQPTPPPRRRAPRSISSRPTRARPSSHLKDFHEPLRESAEIRRRLRDVYENCLGQKKFVVITSPVRFIPEEIERSIMFVELRPPDVVELVQSSARRSAAR